MILNEVAWRPPTIETERVILRGYERSDAEAIYDYGSDPEVARYMSWNRSESIADAHAYLDEVLTKLGYVLAQPYWGNGYVPEAAKALIAHAFEHTDVARIFAPIFALNAKSRRTAEKIGLRFEGVMRSSLELRGRRWDESIYAILREDPR